MTFIQSSTWTCFGHVTGLIRGNATLGTPWRERVAQVIKEGLSGELVFAWTRGENLAQARSFPPASFILLVEVVFLQEVSEFPEISFGRRSVQFTQVLALQVIAVAAATDESAWGWGTSHDAAPRRRLLLILLPPQPQEFLHLLHPPGRGGGRRGRLWVTTCSCRHQVTSPRSWARWGVAWVPEAVKVGHALQPGDGSWNSWNGASHPRSRGHRFYDVRAWKEQRASWSSVAKATASRGGIAHACSNMAGPCCLRRRRRSLPSFLLPGISFSGKVGAGGGRKNGWDLVKVIMTVVKSARN